MTIFQGSQGSISVFYQDKLVASAALTKRRPYEALVTEAYDLVEDAVRSKGLSLRRISQMMLTAILSQRRYNRRFISKEDQLLIVITMIALVRLKIFEAEDVLYVMPCNWHKKARKVP